MDYLWFKAAHVACVLTFTGGLLVQAFAVASGANIPPAALRRATMWNRRVTTPAMVMTLLSGATIASKGAWFSSPWLWAKLAMVVMLTGIHGVQSGRLKRLPQGDTTKTPDNAYAIPIAIALAVIGIALLAVVKPGSGISSVCG